MRSIYARTREKSYPSRAHSMPEFFGDQYGAADSPASPIRVPGLGRGMFWASGRTAEVAVLPPWGPLGSQPPQSRGRNDRGTHRLWTPTPFLTSAKLRQIAP